VIELSTTSQWLTIAVFGALPSIGLVAGPSYALLVFGFGVAQAILGSMQRQWPRLDRQFGVLALSFAALCWASVAWSVDPTRSAMAALQVTAVLAGALFALASPVPRAGTSEQLFRVMAIATAMGCAILVLDTALDFTLQQHLLDRPPPLVGTKYNRGMDHLALIVWPVLGYLAFRHDWKGALLMGLPLLCAVAVTMSLAAQVAMIVGLLVLLAALRLPRLTPRLLTAGVVTIAVATPVGLHLLAEERAALTPYLKISGLHRLEIWDHVTTHLFARPLLGWGIASATRLPMPQEELRHYVILNGNNIYAHDQWLELWVETGAFGAALGLGFSILVLHRIRRTSPAVRPFAYAAFGAGVLISCVNFEVMTDSWWAAVAASGFLFATLEHAVVSAEHA
jgi:exopolysaccharide production protein ExoQ